MMELRTLIMFTLYFATGSAAIPVQIMLEETGANYQAKRLSFADNEQRAPEYLAINPKGRVPALVTPDGVITEVPALLLYLAQSYPQWQLAPTEPLALARAQEFNSYLSSTVHVAHAHNLRGARWSDDPEAHVSMQAKVAENMAECARVIETHYFNGPWVLGEQYSMCDPYLYWISRLMEMDGVPVDDFEKIHHHKMRMLKRPAVVNVIALHE